MSENSQFHIIWLNETKSIDDSCVPSGFKPLLNNAENKINDITILHDKHELINFIHDQRKQNNTTIKILLIMITDLSLKNIVNSAFIQLMEDLDEIDSMYLFCLDSTSDLIELPESSKIRGYSTDLELRIQTPNELTEAETDTDSTKEQQMQQKSSRLSSEDFIFDSLSSSEINDKAASVISYDTTKRQEAEFMYAEILREILIKIDSSEHEMLDYLQQKYANNKKQLAIVDEFQAYYDPCNAVFWYTRDTFLYRLLNTALREQDIDTLYAIRYFIKHLHEQLIELHSLSQVKPSNTATSNIETVYRGQLMKSNEFDKKIRYNTNGFLSISTFFSTTTNKELATFFVSGNDTSSNVNDENSELIRILFQIDIDKCVNKFAYANISDKSSFGTDEGETLFTMGAVFRIVSMNKMDNGLWHIILKLTGDEDEDLCKLTKYVKNDIIQPIPLLSLAKFMDIITRYSKAEIFYILSIINTIGSHDAACTAAIYNDLGLNYKQMGQISKAIRCFQISLDLKLKHLTNAEMNPSVAITYNNLGGIYFAQKDYELAAIMYRNAARIHRASTNPNQMSLATCYNNIATVCKEGERYEDALIMYEKSLEIRLSVLPNTHPMIATVYNNMAHVYYLQGNSKKAAEYWQKTLSIQQISLPSNHVYIGKTYQSISIALYEHDHLEQALEYAKQSQKIKSMNFSADHPKVIEENEWICKVEEELHLHRS